MPEPRKKPAHHKAYKRTTKSGKVENISALRDQVIEADAARKELEEVAGFPSLDSLQGSKIADKWSEKDQEWKDASKSAGGQAGDPAGTPASRIGDADRANPGFSPGGKGPNWTGGPGGGGGSGSGGPGSGGGDWPEFDRRYENVLRTVVHRAKVGYQRDKRGRRDLGTNEAKHRAINDAIRDAAVEFPSDITWQDPDQMDSLHAQVMREAFSPTVTKETPKSAESRRKEKLMKKTSARVNEQVRQSATTLKQKRSMPGYVEGTSELGAGKPIADKSKIQQIAKDKQYSKEHLVPGYRPPKAKVSNKQFLNQAAPEERDWINQQMDNPDGAFFGARNNQVPGKYRKWQQYVNARQAGYAPPTESKDREKEWGTWLNDDQRGQKQSSAATDTSRKNKSSTDRSQKARRQRSVVRSEGTRASQRYQANPVSHEDFGFGVKVPGVDSLNKIKDSLPEGASAKDAWDVRQSAIQSNYEDLLKNDRAAHEQRQEQLLGRPFSDTSAGKSDRVVFFTTSTGFPAASVGASSLVGQYIIKKRKAMVVGDRQATRAQVKGEFPRAVRDQHLVEVSTGLSLGAQGRYGVYKQNGWKKGNTKSKGFGKTIPLGAQVLTGEDGTPIYDSSGNVRYTEGYTKPFDVGTDSNVGLRIFIG